jgi:hypothetical protein
MDSTNAWYMAEIEHVGSHSVWVRYDGWSAKFSEAVPLNSHRLAPFLSFAKLAQRKNSDYRLDIDDAIKLKRAELESTARALMSVAQWIGDVPDKTRFSDIRELVAAVAAEAGTTAETGKSMLASPRAGASGAGGRSLSMRKPISGDYMGDDDSDGISTDAGRSTHAPARRLPLGPISDAQSRPRAPDDAMDDRDKPSDDADMAMLPPLPLPRVEDQARTSPLHKPLEGRPKDTLATLIALPSIAPAPMHGFAPPPAGLSLMLSDLLGAATEASLVSFFTFFIFSPNFPLFYLFFLFFYFLHYYPPS